MISRGFLEAGGDCRRGRSRSGRRAVPAGGSAATRRRSTRPAAGERLRCETTSRPREPESAAGFLPPCRSPESPPAAGQIVPSSQTASIAPVGRPSSDSVHPCARRQSAVPAIARRCLADGETSLGAKRARCEPSRGCSSSRSAAALRRTGPSRVADHCTRCASRSPGHAPARRRSCSSSEVRRPIAAATPSPSPTNSWWPARTIPRPHCANDCTYAIRGRRASVYHAIAGRARGRSSLNRPTFQPAVRISCNRRCGKTAFRG